LKTGDATLLETHPIVHSGVVYQPVDLAEAVLDFSDGRLAAFQVIKVRLHQIAMRLRSLHLAHERLDIVRSSSHNDDPGALRQTGPRNAGANAGSSAGDHNQFV